MHGICVEELNHPGQKEPLRLHVCSVHRPAVQAASDHCPRTMLPGTYGSVVALLASLLCACVARSGSKSRSVKVKAFFTALPP